VVPSPIYLLIHSLKHNKTNTHQHTSHHIHCNFQFCPLTTKNFITSSPVSSAATVQELFFLYFCGHFGLLFNYFSDISHFISLNWLACNLFRMSINRFTSKKHTRTTNTHTHTHTHKPYTSDTTYQLKR